MRTPFRLKLPNWFGDPDHHLLRPLAAVLPLWRRIAGLRPAPKATPRARPPNGKPTRP
ncbi:hypothetical protein ACS5PN_19265 [Roseateles sp. NT4]|uniref:hypothetical protein n=1 Tax=Roseateles sp. NT4 TaxID=3453715 RepID=UPI003EE8813C